MAGEGSQIKSTLFATGAILCWATVAIAFKWALAFTSPAGLLFVSTLTATAGLWLWWGLKDGTVSVRRTLRALPSGTWVRAALLGFINPFLYYLILFKAYSLLPAQVAQSLNVIWPVLLVLLSIPILGQRIGWVALLGMGVSFAGALVIATQGDFGSLASGRLQHPLGVALAAVSAILWALYFLLNMRSSLPGVSAMCLNFLFATLYIILYLTFSGSGSLLATMPPKALWCGVYVGFFEMAVPFILWLNALRSARNTAVVSSLIYVFPFLSLILIHFILKEPIYATTPVGLALIVAGVLLARSKR